MKNAPWTGPASSTPSSVVRSTHLRNIPTSSAAQLKASATARIRKILITAVLAGSFMGQSPDSVVAVPRAGPGARQDAGNRGAPGKLWPTASLAAAGRLAVGAGLVGVDSLGDRQAVAER